MSGGVVFLIGGGVILAASVYIFWPQWQLRQQRKRKPMPPLVRRIPGRPVDGAPLDVYERYRLGLAEWALQRPAVPDPMEQSGDR